MKNNYGQTALDDAKVEKKTDVVEYLTVTLESNILFLFNINFVTFIILLIFNDR